MGTPEFRAGFLRDVTTEETSNLAAKLVSIGGESPGEPEVARDSRLTLVERIDISPGDIRILISTGHFAGLLGVDQARIAEDFMIVRSSFQHRKRGVETKLIIGNEPAEIDETLLRNIGRAHRYFDLVRSGKTFGEIADSEGVSKRRVQQLIELAFLAPNTIRAVWEGRQPVGLTSDWLMRHAFSPIWSEQRELFTAL
jgi:hypothetical protein